MESECLHRQRTVGCKCWDAIWPASSRACGWKALYASTTVYASTTSHRTGLTKTGIQIDKSYHFQIQCSELVKWLENQVQLHIRILVTVRTIGSVLHVNWHQEDSLPCVINVSHHHHHTYKGCFLVKFTNFSATYVVCGYIQWWLSDL